MPANGPRKLAYGVVQGCREQVLDVELTLMDFTWSNQQRELLDAVGRFAAQQLDYNVIENDRDGVFNQDAWKKCGNFGINSL